MIGILLLLDRLIRAFRAVRADPEFRALGGIVLLLLGIGTLFYRQIEGWSWVDSIYFCVVTLATVGYGDFAPTTDTGKIFTIFYILLGVGVLVGFPDFTTGVWVMIGITYTITWLAAWFCRFMFEDNHAGYGADMKYRKPVKEVITGW